MRGLRELVHTTSAVLRAFSAIKLRFALGHGLAEGGSPLFVRPRAADGVAYLDNG